MGEGPFLNTAQTVHAAKNVTQQHQRNATPPRAANAHAENSARCNSDVERQQHYIKTL